MHGMSDRKKAILYHIVNSYISSIQPVGSQSLTKKNDLSFSAATIRNEMCDLEELGFITHPHTSAGRIPTDMGYRYFVDNLIEYNNPSDEEIEFIKSAFHKRIESIDDLIEKTSHIVATLSREACIALLYEPHAITLQQVNLILLNDQRLVVAWVTTTGFIKHDVIDVPYTLDAESVHRIATFLNQEVRGMQFDQIASFILSKLSEERASLYELYQQAHMIVQKSLSNHERSVAFSLEGRSYMLDKPEFRDLDKTRRIMELLEDKNELLHLLRKQEERGVSVRIGKENQREDLWDCTLIGSQYELHNKAIGTIAILGPKRLQYGRILSLLRYISTLMTETITKFEHR